MLHDGWDKRPGVRILFGRWQDVLPQLAQYDGIFWDTFGEDYNVAQRDFHEHLPKLLKPGGIYSFFNGLAADNAFFHQVCCQVAQCELAHLGFDVQYIALPINASDPKIWDGVGNRYWQLDHYFLPIVQFEDSEIEQPND